MPDINDHLSPCSRCGKPLENEMLSWKNYPGNPDIQYDEDYFSLWVKCPCGHTAYELHHPGEVENIDDALEWVKFEMELDYAK